MKIFIGADYRGFDAKQELESLLEEAGYDVSDLGATEKVEGDDFNDPAILVAAEVLRYPASRGILICDSAHGVTMQANRFRGVRAAHCGSVESATLAREHDDANILCMSAHFMDSSAMLATAQAFLATDFVPLERRLRRIKRLDAEPTSEEVRYD